MSIEESLQIGIEHHRRGDLAAAEAIYRQILQIDPNHHATLNLFGMLAGQMQRFDDATRCFEHAIGVEPNIPEYSINLANTYLAQRRFENAIHCCRHAIALAPRTVAAHFIMGKALYRLGRLDAAADCLRQTVALQPDHSTALRGLGAVERDRKRFKEAVAAFEKVVELSPQNPLSQYELSAALIDDRQYDRALEVSERALALKPDYLEAHFSRGTALLGLERYDEAIRQLEQVASAKPNIAKVVWNLGIACCRAQRFNEGIAHCRRAVALEPNSPESHNYLGTALHATGRIDEAIGHYLEALRLNPDHVDSLANLGAAHYRLGRPEAAIASFRQTLAIDPQHVDGRFHLSLALLLTGQLPEGFAEYEWRWKHRSFGNPHRRLKQTMWDGSPFADRTLLIHIEQGLGDALQFSRYVPLAAARGVSTVAETKPELLRLMKNTYPNISWVAVNKKRPAFDIFIPLMSLPRIFGTTLETIPPQSPPLSPDSEIVDRWRARMPLEAGFNVGLAWAGNKTHDDDRNRSLPLTALAPLASVEGVRLFSLQKGEAAAQIKESGLSLTDWTGEFEDLAETAGLIANLDLVITVDTSIAHLAGGMGKPVWTLIPFAPDWRWLQHREDTPWYPSMRLFRQPAIGDWSSVIERVKESLVLMG